ncbi:MAG: response regulator, partial [Ktedonobacterales bacterium]
MAWVLVVDDDEPTRETLRVMLEDAGYAVAEAPDGQAALEMLRSTPYHAIVVFDLLMPVLDGIGFLREVKDDERLAKRH